LKFDLLAIDQADGVFERVKAILQKQGTLKQAQKKRDSLFFLLSYHDKIKDGQKVKIGISLQNLDARYQELEFFGMPLKVMVEADMVACKIIALHERIGKANRDIYDVWYFLDNKWPINKELLERRTGYSFNEFLDLCIQDLEQMTDRDILAGLGELLTLKQKSWAKAELRRKTILLLKLARMSGPT
jgi:Nucleotidyl transferase AbiEii toxin, Type IV TA system